MAAKISCASRVRSQSANARAWSGCSDSVVTATGFYTQDFHPADMGSRTVEALTEEIVRDLVEGIGGTGIRAGIIGEVGCSWPLHPDERRGLVAAGRAQHLFS